MLRLAFSAAVLCLALQAVPAAAAPETAGEYRQLCTGKAAETNQALCSSFITGADQTYALGQKSAEFRKTACIPPQTAPEQLNHVWMSFLNQHPEMAHEPAAASYFRAVARAYPCPK